MNDMKTRIPITMLTAAMALSGMNSVRAQDAQQQQQAAQDAVREAQQRIREAQEQVRRTQDDLRQQLQAAEGEMQARRMRSDGFADRLSTIVVTGGDRRGERPLVIRTSVPDSGAAADVALEEDLSVMSHLLNSSVERFGAESRRNTAMGINVLVAPGPVPFRSMALEGYGAVFMLNVGFPLLGPGPKPEAAREMPPADSAWESAKRDLYGASGDATGAMLQRPGRIAGAPEENIESFSAEKLEELKSELLNALTNATNIRGLKPSDRITVCISGGPVNPELRPRADYARPGGPGPGPGPVPRPAGGGRPGHTSFMTLSVKKSDVDAFAKADLTRDEYRARVSIAIYPGAPAPQPSRLF